MPIVRLTMPCWTPLGAKGVLSRAVVAKDIGEQAFSRQIRRFFHTFASAHEHAVLLEGMPRLAHTVGERDDLNGWVLMGFGARQTACLQGGQLTLAGPQGQTSSLAITPGEAVFDRLRALLASCRQFCPPPPPEQAGPWPFSGGLMGFVGYEFGRYCDPALANVLPDRPPTHGPEACWPDAYWLECDDWVLIDRHQRTVRVFSEQLARTQGYHDAWQAIRRQDTAIEPMPGFCEADAAFRAGFEASLSPQAFAHGVASLQQAISAGELYQANLSIRFSRVLGLDPALLYETLSQRNPSPFSGWLQWPGYRLLSNSPERLVQTRADGTVRMRPIAGTRGRGATAQDDARIGAELQGNEKERAEHHMLVDLARNDLGRVCRAASVQVREQLTLERYSHVTHLVSDVGGVLRPGADAWDALRATFPGGTITGCPKIRCVAHLHALEPTARGPYTGSLGYWDAASGRMDLNILIRTLMLRPVPDDVRYNTAFQVAFSVGAGIVADSVADWEYRECLRKAAALFGALYTCQQPAAIATDARDSDEKGLP